MLEHVPAWLGSLLRDRRAGHETLVIADPRMRLSGAGMTLASPAFAHGARLPVRFTADGEGVSPPLLWDDVPAGTQSLALLVEDPDAPAARPLVHAIVWGLPAGERGLAEGAIAPHGAGDAAGDGAGDGAGVVGRNSFLRQGWLPPDPPTAHGEHDYVFQLFALSEAPALDGNPGRTALVEAMAGRVLGAGVLIGTYSREAPAGAAAGTGPDPALAG